MLSKLRLQNRPPIQFETADEWSEHFADKGIPLRIAPAEGNPAIAWRLHEAQLDQLWAAFGSHGSAIDIEQYAPASGVLFHIPQSGTALLKTAGQTLAISPKRGALVDLSKRTSFHIHAGESFKTIALRVPRGMFDDHLSALTDRPANPAIAIDQGIDLTSGIGAALASLAEALLKGLENDLIERAPIAISNLSQSMLSLATAQHLLNLDALAPVPSIAPRQVRLAIDFMRANLDKPLTIAEIAKASRTTVRTLQGGFRNFKGSNPLAYLRRLRLEAIRAELTDSENRQMVAEIALRWGFAHPGRFSSEYRQAFGELPSETVRRIRRDSK